MTPAAKRYTRHFLLWMFVYSAFVLGASALDHRLDPPNLLRLILAVAPVAPALMALREYVIFFRAMDEVQARIQAEAILIAAGVVGFTSFAWGFAAAWMEWPSPSLIFILPALIGVWGLALPFVSRRYQ